jgi:geranyl-CoA carboxylase alpha subunit
MLAKIIAHGATRDEARRKLLAALGDTALLGISSNREFLVAALAHPVFAAGDADTGFIGAHMADYATADDPLMDAAAAVAWYRGCRRDAHGSAFAVSPELLDWSSDRSLHSRFAWQRGAETRLLAIRPLGSDRYRVGAHHDVTVFDECDSRLTLSVNGHRQQFHCARDGDGTLLVSGECAAGRYPTAATGAGRERDGDAGHVHAPMHGRLAALHVAAGDQVTRGQPLLVIEAMKMQHQVVSPRDARVSAVHGGMNAQVAAGTLLVELEVESQ